MVDVIAERRDGAVTWLTFDRPENLNAFTGAGYQELRVALQRLARDDGVRAVVLTGHGRAFSAGADRSLLDAATPDTARQHAGQEFLRLLDVLGFHPNVCHQVAADIDDSNVRRRRDLVGFGPACGDHPLCIVEGN